MKVLNRPMFRYGGPIKEGIMSGIKEPRRGYNQGNMVFPADAAAMGVADQAKAFENIFQNNINDARIRTYPGQESPPLKVITMEDKIKPYENAINKNFAVTDYFEKDMNTTDEKIPKNTRYGVVMVDNPNYGKVKRVDQVAENNALKFTDADDKREQVATGQIKPDVKLAGDNGDTPPPPPNKKERVNTILESLGYDRAQKNALYDAMIKAGQRVSRGGLGADNLVSDVIAETSQSYDKPEKLREAANLMDVQQQLKLDQIEAGKDTEGTLEKNAKYLLESGVADNAKDAVLSAQGKATEANDIFFEASQKLNSSKALDQTALTLGARGKFGEGIVFKNKVPKKYKGEPIEKFLESGAFRGDGLYTADGKIMLIQDGKIKSELIIRGSIEEGLFSFGGDD